MRPLRTEDRVAMSPGVTVCKARSARVAGSADGEEQRKRGRNALRMAHMPVSYLHLGFTILN
jgi:hypothetical protein